ncbi:MAG: hypothetical protein ABI614_25260 [Planctomycetota bacterium]
MLGMFGMGMQEVLIVGMMTLGVPAIIIAVVLSVSRKHRGDG